MKIVNANMNKTHVQHIIVNRKLQVESASSKIAPSFPEPINRAIELNILKEILFRKRFMIIGSIITAIAIMAIIPVDFFMYDKLDVTVRNASFTEEPTRGTALLIANLAVFIDIESALCDSVFL